MMNVDYYAILGLSSGSESVNISHDDIKQVYFYTCMELHQRRTSGDPYTAE